MVLWPGDVRPGDKDAPAIVLTTGSIPEYAGYELICCIKSIPDAVQLDIEEA